MSCWMSCGVGVSLVGFFLILGRVNVCRWNSDPYHHRVDITDFISMCACPHQGTRAVHINAVRMWIRLAGCSSSECFKGSTEWGSPTTECSGGLELKGGPTAWISVKPNSCFSNQPDCKL